MKIPSVQITQSGQVRLELDPLPQEAVAEAELNEQDLNDGALRQDAILLSSMLYEEGLLALPPNEAEARLEGDTKAQIVELRNSHEQLKKEAEAIEILRNAHSLTEGKAQDLPVYLAGDPGKKGDIAERVESGNLYTRRKVPYESAGSGRRICQLDRRRQSSHGSGDGQSDLVRALW